MKHAVVVLASLFVGLLAVAPIAAADVPNQMHYQGQLTDDLGAPLDTIISMTFTIYDDSSTGASVWWSETHPNVVVNNGLFNVSLGSAGSIIVDTVFRDDFRWLGIQIGSDPEITPLTKLVTVPYAFRVATVDGSTGGVISGDVAIQSDLDLDGDLRVTGKATIGSGHINTGTNAFVAGVNNSAVSPSATVGGGSGNRADGFASTVGGGQLDTASANYATVAGGYSNTASGANSSVGGGADNTASGDYSMVGGGFSSTASGDYNTIGGGYVNTASGFVSTLSGGRNNTASGEGSAVGGGRQNTAGSNYGTVGGGRFNKARGLYSVVAGGGGADHVDSNSAIGQYSTVGGGRGNIASGHTGTVGGGRDNTASGYGSAVGGGRQNTASGDYSAVGGGRNNSNAGDNSAIPGGREDTLTSAADYSMAFGYGVYVDHAYRVVLFDSVNSGRLGINRDDHTDGINHPIHVGTDISNGNGAYLTSGGAWMGGSSRTFKENFQPIDSQDLLARISGLPVEAWQYKDSDERHIGPVSEDFVEAFDVGTVRSDGNRHNQYLSPGDVAGVALAGVKELIQENQELKQIMSDLMERIAELEKTENSR